MTNILIAEKEKWHFLLEMVKEKAALEPNKVEPKPNKLYQVVKAADFRDHRPAFASPLSWTRPKKLDFRGKLIPELG